MNYLLTDSTVMGVVQWVGLVVGLGSVWFAIYQIRQATSAALAARDAANATTEAIFSRERLIEWSKAVGHMEHAKNYLAQGEFTSALIFVDLTISVVIQTNELLVEMPAERKLAQKILVRLRSFGASLQSEQGQTDQFASFALEARDLIVSMNTIAAKLRYRSTDLEVTE